MAKRLCFALGPRLESPLVVVENLGSALASRVKQLRKLEGSSPRCTPYKFLMHLDAPHPHFRLFGLSSASFPFLFPVPPGGQKCQARRYSRCIRSLPRHSGFMLVRWVSPFLTGEALQLNMYQLVAALPCSGPHNKLLSILLPIHLMDYCPGGKLACRCCGILNRHGLLAWRLHSAA